MKIYINIERTTYGTIFRVHERETNPRLVWSIYLKSFAES